ncbi:MAG TPA: MATE family efflux transporter [Oscillospiraceae bacterium]|nr:MATE family efflux transporter [Oscillospiraceae bacterium]
MKEKNRIFVKDRAFYRSFFSMTLVIALQNVITYGVNFADNVMIGNYSEISLSGVSLVNQIQFLLQMVAVGFVNGLVVIAAQYWGKKEELPIKRIFSVVLYLGLIAGVGFTALGLFLPQKTLFLLTNDSAIVANGALYFRIVSISYIFFVISNLIVGLLRSVETVKVGFYMSFCALFFNIGLNYCLIFGKFGFPEMGVEGAAIATLIARIIEFIIAVYFLFFRDNKLKVKLKELFVFERRYFKDYIKTGFPLEVSSASWGIAMLLQTAIIGRLGQSAIAASAIATTIFQVISVVIYGGASASSVIIGKVVGENRFSDAKKYAKTFQVLFVAIGIISSVALFLLKNPIVSIYDISGETEVLAGTFITILSITIMGTAYQMPSLTGIVSGGGDTKFVFYNDLIFMWFIILPFAYLSAFVFHWSVPVTFFVLKSDQIMKCIVAAIKVNRFTWIKKLTH